jgi:hypothetical protein
MTNPNVPPDPGHSRQDRDRALSRVTGATVAGGAGAVLATGALAVWLAAPTHAHPGSSSSTSSTSSSSSSSSSSSTSDDDGLSATQAPGAAQGDSGSQQPPVVSGGS